MSLRVQHLRWWSFQLMFWRIFAFLLLILILSVKLILSRCCSQIRFFRLLVIFQQKWVSIDRVGFLLCLRFWLWHSLWNQRVQHPRWWSFQLRFWRIFTYHLSISKLNVKWILFKYCSQIMFFRLLIIFQRKWVFIDRVGFLLCLRFWL